MGIKKAKSKEVRRLTAAALGVTAEPGLTLERLAPPRRSKQTVLLPGSPSEQASQLVEKLRFEVRAL
jgi:electron transfer flavoprotein beta subunit